MNAIAPRRYGEPDGAAVSSRIAGIPGTRAAFFNHMNPKWPDMNGAAQVGIYGFHYSPRN